MFAATFKTPQCPWRDVYAVGALQFQSVYGIRCSKENIVSNLLTLPRNIVLQPTFFVGLRCVVYHIYGLGFTVSPHSAKFSATAEMRRMCARLSTKNYMCVMFVTVHFGIRNFLASFD